MDRFMALAIRLAKKAEPFPNPKVGAVLVKDGKIIGEGYHKAPGKPHAEIEAIRNAERKTRNPHVARGATLYVSLEPCSHKTKRTPPCTEAIISEGISKVVYGMADPNPLVSGARMLKRAGVEVVGPVAERKGRTLNKTYIANISKKPFVAIKAAMSADGKTATRTGDSKWISDEKSREFVHRMRTEYDAVMVGANTVRCDDPALTSHGKGRDPYRIIIDGRLSIPERSGVLKNKDGKTIVATSESAPKAKLARLSKKALVLRCGRGKVDLKLLAQSLGAMGIKRMLIEGGSELNAEALDAGIIDRLYLFVAPKLIGGKEGKGVFGGKGIAEVRGAMRLGKMKMKRIGGDLLLQWDLIR
ncbi:MAG: bifunctional diaminohydroxyphosphoribosylaminopyrimidine deaminase/5-amino-6-(5-phosphoribosylamino)uracil reductase RibD [Candidatus Micrarchaeota archaeon]